MVDHIGVQTIPDCKMIRSPEADSSHLSKYIQDVHKELTQVHKNRKILGIVPVILEGKEYFLVGLLSKGNVITPNPTTGLKWAPFARLLSMEEWKEVLRDSGARLRYCTPIRCELYDPYKAVEIVSSTPMLRLCTLAAKWGDKNIDLLAVYHGSIIGNNVEGYIPFAMIISDREAEKFWVQGHKDPNAISGERFLRDRSQSPTMGNWEGPAKEVLDKQELDIDINKKNRKIVSMHKMLKDKPSFETMKGPAVPFKPPEKKQGKIILP